MTFRLAFADVGAQFVKGQYFMGPSEIRYVRSGKIYIAYRVVGDGPLDAVHVPGWVSHFEMCWSLPQQAALLNRIAGFDFEDEGTHSVKGFPAPWHLFSVDFQAG